MQGGSPRFRLRCLGEDILWWSMDRQHWSPVDESLWPRKKRWLVVESEEGVYPALSGT